MFSRRNPKKKHVFRRIQKRVFTPKPKNVCFPPKPAENEFFFWNKKKTSFPAKTQKYVVSSKLEKHIFPPKSKKMYFLAETP